MNVTDRLYTDWLHIPSCPDMDIRQRLAKNMRKLRHAKGWSQEELAHQAGLHRTYVSDLERSARNPSIAIIEKLEQAFNVNAGALLD